jgi:hypothetical protein
MRLIVSAGEPVLSKREQDAVRCVAEGLSNPGSRGPGTYRAYRQELLVSDFRQARRFPPR